ncbi:hypothetical protein P7K49_035565, partial [Saguinus oedipus]
PGTGLDPVCLVGCAQVQSHATPSVKLEAVIEPLATAAAATEAATPGSSVDGCQREAGPAVESSSVLVCPKAGHTADPPFCHTWEAFWQHSLGSLSQRVPATAAVAQGFEPGNVNSEPEEEEGGLEDDDGDDEVAGVAEKETQAASKYFHVQQVARQDPRAAPMSNLLPAPGLPSHGQQSNEDHTKDASKASPSVSTAG